MNENNDTLSGQNAVAIAAIFVIGAICMCCIAAFAAALVALFINLPW
jgi:hypothetical protein